MTEDDFGYDPETGIVHNKTTGRTIGAKQSKGYITVEIRGKTQLVHRFAFFKMTGKWPEEPVDHINRDRTDNRWTNLRTVSNKENRSNSAQSIPECRAARWEKQMNDWLKTNLY
jgi:hypothetical protein